MKFIIKSEEGLSGYEQCKKCAFLITEVGNCCDTCEEGEYWSMEDENE